jgi:hypothetical protein
MTATVSANVIITTACNRHCPSCCYQHLLASRPGHHREPADIVEEVRLLASVPQVCLLGGEPTLHPALHEVLAAVRQVRPSPSVVLVTNGARVCTLPRPTLSLVDRVWLTAFPGVPVEAIREYCPVPVDVHAADHEDFGGGPQPCDRLLTTVSVLDGRVYPCCVACGVADAQSAELRVGWETVIAEVPPPCAHCVFGRA